MQDFIGQPFYIGNNPGNTDLEGVGNNFPQNIGNYLLVTQCRPRRLERATSWQFEKVQSLELKSEQSE